MKTNNKIQEFIYKTPMNEEKSSYIWNLINSVFIASSSVIMTSILVRYIGVVDTGYYSVALAISGIISVISSLNIYTLQVINVFSRYKFEHFFTLRIIFSIIALVVTILYLIIKNNALDKNVIIFLQCAYRLVDSFCEIFQGELQKTERMYSSSKLSFITHFSSDMLIFILVMTVGKINIAIFCAIILKIILLIFSVIGKSNSTFLTKDFSGLIGLTYQALPLFISSFLITYIQASSKLAIDKYLNPTYQTIFSVIFMPTMAINLVTGIIYRPIITKLFSYWNDNQFKKIKKNILTICSIIFVFTILSVIVGYFLGIPFLNLVFDMNLSEYKPHLIITLLAGGFNAVSTFLTIFIIMNKKQRSMIIIYGGVAVFALIFSGMVVEKYSLYGASIFYLALMIMQALLTSIYIIYLYLKKKEVHFE